MSRLNISFIAIYGNIMIKPKIVAGLLVLAILLTSLAACGEKATVKAMLTKIDGEPVPEPVTVDFAEASDDELSEYFDGYEKLKAEICGSDSTVDLSQAVGTVYYVSNNGDDDNDGLTPETAFKTPLKGCRKASREGDVLCFERGSVFRGKLDLNMGVTYTCYGEGDKPIFLGSRDASSSDDWELTDAENIYVYKSQVTTDQDVGQIIFDGGKAWGIKVMKVNAEDIRVDQGEVTNGIDTFNNGQAEFSSYKDLLSNLEFWCDPSGSKLYLYSSAGNPGDVFESVELAMRGNIASGNANKVTVDNLVFKYGGSHGIGVANAKDFTVRYCEFYYIGGSIQAYDIFSGYQPTRFGNAVENWTECKNFKIDHCYASQIYDCCFTTQWQGDSNGASVLMEDVEFSNNISEYANTGLEVWMSDNVGYPDADYRFRNFDMHDNYTLYSGYGWSHQRPNKDANFFYGGLNMNSTKHENSVFHDNVNLFTKKYGLFARYTGGKDGGHTFKDNVYVMEYGQTLALSAKDGPIGQLDNYAFTFTEEGLIEAKKANIEVGSKFRYVLPEDPDITVEPYTEPRFTFEEYLRYNPSYNFTSSAGRTYPVRIVLPENFDPEKEYPLVVFLHAEYQAGDNNTSHVLNNDPLGAQFYTEQTDDDAVFLAMQLPKGMTWTGTDAKTLISVYSETEPDALADLNELVDLVAEGAAAKIDKSNISLAGQSNGATAIYDILTRHPDKYVRAGIAGGGIMSGANIGNTSVRVVHGEFDFTFTPSDVEQYVNAMSDSKITYRLIKGADHDAWNYAYDHGFALWLIGK